MNLIRETGKKWIHERIDAINNDEPVPTDILTQITKMIGKARANSICVCFVYFRRFERNLGWPSVLDTKLCDKVCQ